MGRLAAKLAGAITAFLFLASCSAISVIDTWRSPTAPAKRYQKLLVASLAKNTENRRVYEDIIVGEFSQLGVVTVPSYTLLTGKARQNRQTLLDAAKRAGADGLLMIQTTRIERQTDVQPGFASTYRDRFTSDWDYYGRMSPYGGLGPYGYGGYGGYGTSTLYEPPTIYSYDIATIQATLFDVESAKLTWAATMETMEPARVVKVGKELAREVTRSLAKEGLI